MNRKQAALAALSLIMLAASGGLRTAFAELGNPQDKEPGWVAPCSLVGVNPVFHPEIFGNAATARRYGFVRAKDGTWHVVPNCRR
jgi:hypothetical protein